MTNAAALLVLLEGLLREENLALTRMEINRAAEMLPDKQRLAEALNQAGALHADAETIDRLRRLAADNRTALARALRVQRRMLDILSAAARRARPAPGYGPAAKKDGVVQAMMMRTRV